MADNLVQLKLDDYKNQFGLVFTGKIEAPKDAEYTFELASDDGGRIPRRSSSTTVTETVTR